MHKPRPLLRRHAGHGRFHPEDNRHQFRESESDTPPDRLAAVITSQAFRKLVQLGCSTDVLRHSLHRFAIACSRPTTKREAFKRAGIGQNQIQRRIAEAKSLLEFIRCLQINGEVAIANEMPPQLLFPWRKTLEDIATWLDSIQHWQPHPMDAALALVLHVKEVTDRRKLLPAAKIAIHDLLLNARETVGATWPALTLDSLERHCNARTAK